jgi:hypothetical protein
MRVLARQEWAQKSALLKPIFAETGSIRGLTSYGTARRRGPLLSFARTNPDAQQEKQNVSRNGAVHLRASLTAPVSGSRLASGYRESIWRAANPLCQSLQ